MRLIFLFLIFSGGALSYLLGGPQIATASLNDLIAETHKVQDRVSVSDRLTLLFLETISENAAFLKKLQERNPAPEQYQASLRNAARVLAEVARSPRLDESELRKIREVADDLAVKKTYALRNPVSPYEIRVNIRMSKVYSSKRIQYLWKGFWRQQVDDWHKLPKDGEIILDFSPGIYAFRAEGRENYVAAVIGMDGRKESEVDLDPLFWQDPVDLRRRAGEVQLDNLENSVRVVQEIEPHEWLEVMRNGILALLNLNRKRVIPSEYSDLVLDSNALIARMIQDGRLDDKERESLSNIARDFSSLAHRALNEKDWPEMILVFVRTRDPNRGDVHGLEVWYVAPGYKKNREKYRRFDRWSTPTWQKLPPVRWILWAQDPNKEKHRGLEKPIVLTDSSESYVIYDLPCPE